MNNGTNFSSHEDLITEKARLERLIENQKNIIRHDFDELKLEFKKEIRPAIDAAAFVRKFARKDTRNETLLSVGTSLLTTTISKLVFRKSSFLLQLVGPKLIQIATAKFLPK